MSKECMNCKYCRIVENTNGTYTYYCQASSKNENIEDMEEVAYNGTCNSGNWEVNNV